MSALSPRLHSLSDVEIAIEQAVHGDEHCHEVFFMHSHALCRWKRKRIR